jgi:D-3-phosphoglycerate dehydrogenase
MPKENNILITTSSFDESGHGALEQLRGCGFSVTHNPHGRRLTEAEVSELIGKVRPVGIIAGLEPLTEKVLKGAEGLKAVSRLGTGMDNVDLAAAQSLNIGVSNTPDAPAQAVAELTVGLMIASLRSIPAGDAAIRAGRWERGKGRLLGEQTVGIIGCGRIGKAVADILRGVGAKIIGFDPHLAECADIELVDWDTLLAKADIITLHIPLSQETKKIINEDSLDKMKSGAIIVNASRGGIVDESALYGALKEGRVAGACLDCFEEEPYAGELRELPQVICTPHIGSYTIETRIKMEQEAVENLLAALGEV